MPIVLKDNTPNGFWKAVLTGDRSRTNQTIQQTAIGSPDLMRVVGEEAISAIKGGPKHKYQFFFRAADKTSPVNNPFRTKVFSGLFTQKFHQLSLTITRHSSGEYSTGIQKGISPDGKPYEPLSEATLRHRQWKSKRGEVPPKRGATYILRETSKHIMNGLKILSISAYGAVRGTGARTVKIGWTGKDYEIAQKQNRGNFKPDTPWYDRKVSMKSKVPARQFIGFSTEFQNTLQEMVRSFVSSYRR